MQPRPLIGTAGFAEVDANREDTRIRMAAFQLLENRGPIDGRLIHPPASPSLRPDPTFLERRYKRFRERAEGEPR